MIDSNLLLWGYNASKFEFWNETTDELIFEHRSGGAHRVWDFYVPPVRPGNSVDEVARNSWLVYTSKSEVLFLLDNTNFLVVLPPSGREVLSKVD